MAAKLAALMSTLAVSDILSWYLSEMGGKYKLYNQEHSLHSSGLSTALFMFYQIQEQGVPRVILILWQPVNPAGKKITV